MLDQSTLEGKVITAAMDLAASPGWGEVSLRDIADAAGCSLADVMAVFETKQDIVAGFRDCVDRAMLAGAVDIEREQSARDALFEVIMSRFDLMAPYKAGLKSIVAEMNGRIEQWMQRTGDSWDVDWTHPVEDKGRLYRHETFYTVDEYLAWAKEHPELEPK